MSSLASCGPGKDGLVQQDDAVVLIMAVCGIDVGSRTIKVVCPGC